MGNLRKALTAGSLLALAAQASAAPVMFKGDPALTGVHEAAPPRAMAGIAFTFRTGGPIRGTAAVANGTIYVGSTDHHFYAIDAHSGRQKWSTDIDAPITSSAAVANGLVYFTARDRRLHALNAANGRPVWSAAFGPDLGEQNYWDFYTSSPVLAAGRLIAGGGDGFLYAFDPRSGRRLWRFDAGSRIRSTPAVADGIAVFGAQDGVVRAVDITSGRALWNQATAGAAHDFALKHNDTKSVYASPSIADNVVTIGARDSYLYAFDLRSGHPLWRTTHDGGSWILSTAIEGGHVYVGSGSAFILQAADLHSGAEQWRFKTDSAVFGSPAIVGDVVLFDDIAGMVYALDRRDGHELWRVQLSDRSFSSPVPYGDMVFVGCDDGLLYAIRTAPQPRPRATRLIYFEGNQGGQGFSWFEDGFDQAILSYFKRVGYAQVDAEALRQAMVDQIAKGGRSIVVFADNKVPASVAESDDDHALIRRYLDSGGRIIFLGNNPLSFVRDKKSGEIVKLDVHVAEHVLSLTYPSPDTGIGYHVSEPTAAGRAWGLRDPLVASSSMRPQSVTVTLARDEFGMATSWAKDYPHDGMLIQLTPPRNRVTDMAPYQMAAEHGL